MGLLRISFPSIPGKDFAICQVYYLVMLHITDVLASHIAESQQLFQSLIFVGFFPAELLFFTQSGLSQHVQIANQSVPILPGQTLLLSWCVGRSKKPPGCIW